MDQLLWGGVSYLLIWIDSCEGELARSNFIRGEGELKEGGVGIE